MKDGLSVNRGAAKFVADSTSFLPSFAAAAKGFGQRPGGAYDFAIAYSVFQLRDAQDFDIVLDDGITDTVFVDRSDRVLFHGVSGAYSINDKWHVGLGIFLRTRSIRHQEVMHLSQGGVLDQASGLYSDSDSLARLSVVSSRMFQFSSRIGVLYRPNRRWRFGALLVHPPLVLVRKGRVRQQIQATFQAMGPMQGMSRYRYSDINAVRSRPSSPAELTVGSGVSGAQQSPH